MRREMHIFHGIGRSPVFVRGVQPFPPFLLLSGGVLGTFLQILKVPVCKVPVCELLRTRSKSEQIRTNRGIPEKQGAVGIKNPSFLVVLAYSGLFGAAWDQFLRTPQPQENSRKCPFLAQLVPFGPSPRLLSPHLDFPDIKFGGSQKGGFQKGALAECSAFPKVSSKTKFPCSATLPRESYHF